MVSRARLLLTALALLGCRPEDLGVEVRKGGLDSLSVEDLLRDVEQFSKDLNERGPGERDEKQAAERLKLRLEEMRTLPSFGRDYTARKKEGPWRTCGHKEGLSDQAVVWAALDVGSGAKGGGVPRAAVVSLAKAWDTYETPPEKLIFCALAADGGLDDYLSSPAHPLSKTERIVTFGPLGDGELTRSEGVVSGVSVVHYRTPATEVGQDEDRMETVDYRRVLPHIEALYYAGLETSE